MRGGIAVSVTEDVSVLAVQVLDRCAGRLCRGPQSCSLSELRDEERREHCEHGVGGLLQVENSLNVAEAC